MLRAAYRMNIAAASHRLVGLCAAADVEPDTPVRVLLDNVAYAVFSLNGQFYVTQDQCTHGPGSLSEGFVMETEIECPFHQGRFDIRTGQPTGAPCIEALRTWTVHVINGQIAIDPAEQRGVEDRGTPA
jgi:nitrite reductase/ring-hydroxylating ferredoxin subunit